MTTTNRYVNRHPNRRLIHVPIGAAIAMERISPPDTRARTLPLYISGTRATATAKATGVKSDAPIAEITLAAISI